MKIKSKTQYHSKAGYEESSPIAKQVCDGAHKINNHLKPKVFVAISGGVDSSVAGLLLKKEGYEITGVFMKNWEEGCEWKEDRRDAMRVCAKLNVPFLTFDFTREYKKEVIDYMVKEYQKGNTPNPDVMCNKTIKFGWFLKKARAMGADYIATGHYVRLTRKSQNTNYKLQTKHKTQNTNYMLAIARDKNKDQSYFLWTLTQKQLKYCLFPIGDYIKSEVREIARKNKLITANKKDSQGLCFVGKIKFSDFLNNLLKKKPKKGKIKNIKGEVLGEHEGLEFYTIGQRHGLKIGGGNPYFVIKKDIKKNELIVGEKNNPLLFKKEIFVKNINWISNNSHLEAKLLSKKSLRSLASKWEIGARIRYRQPLQECEIYVMSNNRLRVLFKKPIWAVAIGQSIVFYKGKGIIGGGIIDKIN